MATREIARYEAKHLMQQNYVVETEVVKDIWVPRLKCFTEKDAIETAKAYALIGQNARVMIDD